MRRDTVDKRERILWAAERLVVRSGVSRLTLEGVAAEAGISKGGLLYHFPSKDRLVSAMVEHLAIERFEREMERRLAATDAEPGSWTRAYLAATFEPEDEQRNSAVSAGLLAAVAADPEQLAPLRKRYRELQEQAIRDGVDPASATAARLAADGLWFLEIFGLAPLEGELRQRVHEQLREMTHRAPEER